MKYSKLKKTHAFFCTIIQALIPVIILLQIVAHMFNVEKGFLIKLYNYYIEIWQLNSIQS